ncbi:uncharacterized protein Z518_02464 [Rhinocladiella mackenziei CBS 650.93]|uniref:HNH nuclease domain-containing protein n=1 Tax=Rhinocladiella mackenziei CBS 650.93 TaxID=1442369 RepID=A0A0D2JF27_9EURO|nr:uncharacterized protein Z518_02464 [Rhinocladiella mackenziei CBS 650.93]KIX07810.1 hypothetical protein Z518_02464 [Rhinocladiella mackenziei CBS 650.93]
MAPSSKKRSKKGSPKSPKETRKRMTKATAPEIDFNSEDYNIRSPERTQLLTQVKEAIGDAPVSSAFWACFQLADMNQLNQLLVIAKVNPEVVLGYDEPLVLLPLKWSQRFKDSGSEAVSQRSGGAKKRKLNANGQSWVQRSAIQADKCKERDDYKCVLTNQLLPREAHIFPYSMLNSPLQGSRSQTSKMIPDFWKLLHLFWDKDRIKKWKETIFQDSQNPNTGIDRCFNLISLDASVHVKWTKGLFALKPLRLSSDRKELTVQFFWQVPSNYDMASRIDLLTEPTSSEGLEVVANGHWLTRFEDDGSLRAIRSGELVTLTTKDPENLPLPSVELFEMQWVLQRLVGMSGAAGWPILDLDDENVDDDGWFVPDLTPNLDNSLKRVCEWVTTRDAADVRPEISTATPCPSVIPCQ